MSRGLLFGALSAPGFVLSCITLWAESKASAWTPPSGELSLPVRTALALNNWTIRLLPFAVVILMLVWPLIVLGIAAVTGAFSSRNTATRRDVIFWWCVSAITFGVVFLLLGVAYALGLGADTPAALLASLAWPAMVAFWVSLAAAYAVQQRRRLTHPNAWDPKWLLAALAALSCVGVYAVPVLAAIAFRRDEATQQRAGYQ